MVGAPGGGMQREAVAPNIVAAVAGGRISLLALTTRGRDETGDDHAEGERPNMM